MKNIHFIESLAYQIELTSRICHETFKRWFEEKVGDLISTDEFIILDTLDCNPGLSQIELANTILKGKAHTGKFLDSMEAKGYIKRLYDTKNSRMVKIPVITDKGKELYNKICNELHEIRDLFERVYPQEDVDKLANSLKHLRETVVKIENISFN